MAQLPLSDLISNSTEEIAYISRKKIKKTFEGCLCNDLMNGLLRGIITNNKNKQ